MFLSDRNSFTPLSYKKLLLKYFVDTITIATGEVTLEMAVY